MNTHIFHRFLRGAAYAVIRAGREEAYIFHFNVLSKITARKTFEIKKHAGLHIDCHLKAVGGYLFCVVGVGDRAAYNHCLSAEELPHASASSMSSCPVISRSIIVLSESSFILASD